MADDSANYSADNQNKEIKKGASLEVEVAYVLNDTTRDLEVEISELFSYSDKDNHKNVFASQLTKKSRHTPWFFSLLSLQIMI